MKQFQDYHPLHRPPQISKSSTPQELEVYLKRAGFENISIGEYKLWVYACGCKPLIITNPDEKEAGN
jgi:hypothetical protein